MDPTPSSLDPYASMLKDSAWAPVSFHIDPKVDSDLAAVMAMPAGDVQLDDDPAWTPPADDGVPFGYSGKDASGARVGGGYTQGYNQGTRTYADTNYPDPQHYQSAEPTPSANAEVNGSDFVDLTEGDNGLAAPIGMEAQFDQTMFAPTLPEPTYGPAAPFNMDAEVNQSVEDMEVGFIHDVVCEAGTFPTVEDTRRIIAEALAKVKGYGGTKEKFMPVASFLAKMKRCLETRASYPDFSAQHKFWTMQGFHLEGEIVYKNASADMKGTRTPQHPVPAREDCHKHLIAAHSAANHGGRDETQKALTAAGVGIFISKDFITKWIRLCPTCGRKNKSYAPRKKGTKGPCINAGVRKARPPPKAKRPARQPSPAPGHADTQSTVGVPLLPISSPPIELPQYREETYSTGEGPVIADPSTGDASMEVPRREDPFMGNPRMEDPSMDNIDMEDPDLDIFQKEWGSWPEDNLLPELPDYGAEFPSGYAANNDAR